jgi:hypothetical protein
LPTLSLVDVDVPRNRSWRAFQLAFLLLNFPALTSVHHPDRNAGPFAAADFCGFQLVAERRKLTLAWLLMQSPYAASKRVLVVAMVSMVLLFLCATHFVC